MDYPLFHMQHLIAPFRPGPIGLARFLTASRKWIAQNYHRFDVFHGLSGFHYTVAPAYCAERHGLPAALFMANSGIELTDKRGLKALLGLPRKRRAMVRRLSAVIAMSEEIQQEARNIGVADHRIFRIPMGVDADRFSPAENDHQRAMLRRKLRWANVATVLFVGGINRRKRPHLLIDVVAKAGKRGMACQLILAGPEQETDYVFEMKQKIQSLGLDSRVIWHGFTDKIEVLYKAADIFVLPSEREGMSAALVEAMASGLPPIVTPVSGVADLLQSGTNGRVVDGSVAQLGDALESYLRDPQLREAHGRAARETILTRCSSEAVLQQYQELYQRIMLRRHC
jgi:glycosyltransferase involved in cell wall biosynthesis